MHCNVLDPAEIVDFEKLVTEDFLHSHEFGEALRRRNTTEFQEFCNRRREFAHYFIDVIVSHHVISAEFLQCIYCFCPEQLLEGDDHHDFDLLIRLVRVLEMSGPLWSSESKAATEAFVTFVVDIRSSRVSGGSSADEIGDFVSYLLVDYSFLFEGMFAACLSCACCLLVQIL